MHSPLRFRFKCCESFFASLSPRAVAPGKVFVAETDIGFAVGTDCGMLLVHVLGVGINGLPSLGGHALVDTRSIDR